jgi:DNA-binding transcriptional ArsR family regulator
MSHLNSEHPLKAASDRGISYSLMADFLRSFSDPKVLMVLNIVRKEELTPSAISKRLGISQQTASAKLKMMARKGILTSNVNSRSTSYWAADSILLETFDRILEFSNHKPKCAGLGPKHIGPRMESVLKSGHQEHRR